MKNILVVIPTYNERENARELASEIFALNGPFEILFVDDNSPDGTGKMLEEMKMANPKIHVLHRSGKQGVGSAHKAGIYWAYENAYPRIITMDCDFTHRPKYLLEILALAEDFDIVVGSRFKMDKSLKGWNAWRKFLTNFGHVLTRVCLSMPYDATGGFRLYNLSRIPRYGFDEVRSKGYSFFFESLYLFHVNKFRVGELPIDLPPRTYGHSKMDFSEILKSVKLLLTTLISSFFEKERFLISEGLQESERNKNLRQSSEWDSYWKPEGFSIGIYGIIASVYRKWIIRPRLNRYITTHFSKGDQILHAGCGSGQVDSDVSKFVKLTGLDSSVQALNLYRKNAGGDVSLVHASIMDIPTKSGTWDGVYNLGVMEHFAPEDIAKILNEFNRVLKPGGKAIVFWPPRYGLSVLVLKSLKWFFKKVLRRQLRDLHPAEITLGKSRGHIEDFFLKSNFEVTNYSFSPSDLFTYSVVVARKPTANNKPGLSS